MVWTKLGFGKHKGRTFPQIIFCDPDWFFWAMENEIFEEPYGRRYLAEANKIYNRARNVKIPYNEVGDQVVEHTATPWDHSYVRFDIIDKSQGKHAGSSPTYLSDRIDFGFPRQLSSYDKSGYRGFLHSFKFYVTGYITITPKVAEAFFDDEGNFEEGD